MASLHARSSILPSLALVLVLAASACNGCRNTQGTKATASPSPGEPPTVRIYFASNVAGALEPCGCVKDQLGGLDHAAAWFDAEKPQAPWSVLVTAGPTFFMDPLLEKDHKTQDVAKADAMADAMKRVGLVAFAPGENDWADGPSELAKIEQTSGAPALLANVAGDAGARTAPYRIAAINNVRVAFIGVGAAPKGVGAGGSMAEAVASAVKAAQAEGGQIFILLASVGRGEAKRIADAVPQLNAVVVGDYTSRGEANARAPSPESLGKVLIVESANHLQAVGVLDFFVKDGSFDFADATGIALAEHRAEIQHRADELHVKIANWVRDRSISQADLAARRADLAKLEAELAVDTKPPPATGSYFRYAMKEIREHLGKDPGVAADIAGYYRKVNDANRIELEGRLPIPAAPGQPSYIGVDACRSCHASEVKFWNKTAHARAYVTLSSQSKEFNLDCVSCHVTGYDKPGGCSVTHVDRLKDVQCEVCHGPGSLHAASPTSVKPLVPQPSPDLCVTCHHPPHVEGFDAPAKMSLIVGPGHGR